MSKRAYLMSKRAYLMSYGGGDKWSAKKRNEVRMGGGGVTVRNGYERESEVERGMREAFEQVEEELREPVPIAVPPSPSRHNQLCLALLYAILTDPTHHSTHIKHLHAIVLDSYSFFTNSLTSLVLHLFPLLLPSVHSQLLLLPPLLLPLSPLPLPSFLLSLLRHLLPSNTSLSSTLLSLFSHNIHSFLAHHPSLLSMALYSFLRLLPHHHRLSTPSSPLQITVNMESHFCLSILRFHFHVGLAIGRDLLRLLQDLLHIPEFRDLWRDLMFHPDSFCTPGFSDVSQIYSLTTPTFFFLLGVSPQMETRLRFLLSRVKLGAQKRYQLWFVNKFLSSPEREACICDIVRFVCRAHHPPNQVIQSDVIPRWAVVGWLLKCCRHKHVESSAMLALFYDWLFFDSKVDNVMNIEPAILLMVNSLPKYVDLTHSLLTFLFTLVDGYDVDRKGIISQGVLSSFETLVAKGVVRSLDVLTSSECVAPPLRERIGRFVSAMKPSQIQTRVFHSRDGCEDRVSSWIGDLQETCGKSSVVGLQILQDVISMCLLCDKDKGSGIITLVPGDLSWKLGKQLELNGYRLFSAIDLSSVDDEVFSPTSLLLRAFIFNSNMMLQEMMWFWSRSGLPVGTRLLFYASRLALEFELLGFSGTLTAGGECWSGSMGSCSQFLKNHIDMYTYFASVQKRGTLGPLCSPNLDKKMVSSLIDSSFSAYRCFLLYSSGIIDQKEGDRISQSKILFTDIVACLEWDRKRLKLLFCGVFRIVLQDEMMVGEEIIRLMVEVLDHTDLLDIQFDLRLKIFSIFGGDPRIICGIIRRSLSWDFSLQIKLWGLLRSEIPVSNVQFEKAMLEFFCSDQHVPLEQVNGSIAVEGFLSVCTSLSPTPELVGALVLFPNTMYRNFTSAVLSAWAVSNASMLFESIGVFFRKLQKQVEDSPAFLGGFVINQSAIHWLLSRVDDTRGSNGVESLDGLSLNMIEKLREMSKGFYPHS